MRIPASFCGVVGFKGTGMTSTRRTSSWVTFAGDSTSPGILR
ncbi:hypothetical protein [Kribbella catacumbae]